MFALDDTLAPELYPLAFLVGTWRGTGVISYPGIADTPFGQQVEFSHDGGPYLSYTATIVVPADAAEEEAGHYTRVWSTESGYWRVVPGAAKASEPQPNGAPGPVRAAIEVMLAEPTGHLTLLVGQVEGARIDLESDAIVRTATAAEVAAAKRLYGLVGGELMWVIELAAFGNPMASYASARLSRVDGQVDGATATDPDGAEESAGGLPR